MDVQKLWQRVLDLIKSEISSANYKTWFSQSRLKSLDDDKVVVLVPSAFVKGQLLSRYEQLVKSSLNKVLGKDLEIEYQIDSSLANNHTDFEDEGEGSPFTLQSQNSNQSLLTLNPKYTLKNFVVGLTNNLAYAAAQAVVQNPGISYNPLFIYGPSGVGKTHLMQGIGNELLAKNPALKLIYASSEKFMNDLVESIQNKRTGAFRAKYRSSDILLIDDIQFFSGKDSTQEEFFHTFNELQSRNSQIVLTSDRPPNEIQKLESRLASRFQGGLMVDVQLPDFDTRIAILKAKLKERGESLPDECISFIAESFPSNTRELEGKLIQVLQMLKLSKNPASLESVRQFLGRAQINQNQTLDHKKLLGSINSYFNLKLSDLIGPRRQKELVLPRQIAMFLMYEECKLPMEKIGNILGGRDHTTILHGIDKIREAISRDREIQRLVIDIKQQLVS